MTDREDDFHECPRCGAPWMDGRVGTYYWCGSAPGNQDDEGTTCKSLAKWLPQLRADRKRFRSALVQVAEFTGPDRPVYGGLTPAGAMTAIHNTAAEALAGEIMA